MKVSVQNYQIIKQAILDFNPGLTAIVGPSNNGKSSLLKALKAAIYTDGGTTPIRHGENSYTVGIQNDKHVVIFQKKEGSSKYLVDGQTYSKFGLTTPEEVSNALNMRELVLNGNKVQLNFWNQMDKPFLLDKSAGELFKFIVDSGENDQLSNVLKSMVSDRQQINRDADTVQGSILSSEGMIKEQENLLEKSEKTLPLADKIIDLKEDYDSYKNILESINQYKNNDKEIEKLRPKLLKDLNEFNRYNSLNYLSETSIKISTEIQNILKKLAEVDDSIYISKTLLDINEKNLNIFKDININKNKNLITLVEKYKEYLEKEKNVSEVNLKLQKAIPSQTIIDTLNILIKLVELFESIKGIIESIKNAKNKIKEIENEEKELDKIQSLIKVCPYCGQKIGGNHDTTEHNS